MSPLVAGATVFFTSGAVLVLEILALRLLAPYVGVTIETYTATIATVLAGISLGTWLGGRAADRIEPRRLLGPLLVVGGALGVLSVPLVRWVGAGGGGGSVVGLSLVGFFAPAAVLSAVTPTVVKLQLRDLGATGRIVGRLSALGTAGAIIGTYLAGFVLVEAVATSTSILAVGGALMVAGVWLWLGLGRGGAPAVVAAVVLGLLAGSVAVRSAGPCHVETVYHCARVVEDGSRPGGRLLLLDTLRHSYVDLDDPTHLEFAYARVFADVIATVAPAGPLRALHVGGGGFTLPRYLRAVRPGTASTVLEIDPGLVRLSRDRLGLVTGPDLDVHVGDGRLLLDSVASGAYDVVLGDAFGGLAVPWHLTTQEFLEAVRARVGAGGVYLMNLIDYPPMRFARSEVATLSLMFDDVAVIAPADVVEGRRGGNIVLVAGVGRLDVAGLASRIAARGGAEVVVSGPALAGFVDGAPALSDDFAPVDQWLSRSRRG